MDWKAFEIASGPCGKAVKERRWKRIKSNIFGIPVSNPFTSTVCFSRFSTWNIAQKKTSTSVMYSAWPEDTETHQKCWICSRFGWDI